jgi:ATP-dependent Clp protease ATP-binding subunit ClpC
MREPLTETLRQVLDDAQREARAMNQEFVGTEHLLLGMLNCDRCESHRVLQKAGIEPVDLRAALMRELPKGTREPVISGNLPFSPKAQRTINAAIVKAQLHHEPRIATRIVLLALLEEPETLIRRAMAEAGADLQQLCRLLAEPLAEREA